MEHSIEKNVHAVPYAVLKLCEICEKGEYLPTGNNKYTPDIQIEHKCNHCGKTQTFKESYPAIRFYIDRDHPPDLAWGR